MCCGILYWQEMNQAADLLRQLTLVLAAPSYHKIILRKKICRKWGTGWRSLCAQLCPERCPHIAKLASGFWGPTAKCGWVVKAQKSIPVGFAGCKSCTCSHNDPAVGTRRHPAKLFPPHHRRAATCPPTQRTHFFQNWWVFPQHLPTNKFNESRVN